MQSSNPILTRSEGFNGQGGELYADFNPALQTSGLEGRMTIDTVVQKTAITLGVVVLTAAATWALTGTLVNDVGDINQDVATRLYVISVVGSLAGFALSMMNSFKRVVNPALVLAYAAFQGIAVGALSKVLDATIGAGDHIVVGAVVGTFAAVAGTLAAYKVFDIQVGSRFRKWVTIMMFGFVGLTLFDFVLSLFHADLGINGFGGVGLLFSFLGLGLGVFMLILDFDYVERGIAAGLPEQESWRAAFGLTVTIVWIYIELLRILAILRGD
ncbi:Bax inhibitor-1/YccA family protein [Marmoricola sp. RAF53]|uniref:Bax inhibitor-1/YccA family protein n=1 Tax=Marmoricola sp. RAF53 TaxID=3233059 RepID=UPI003F948D74